MSAAFTRCWHLFIDRYLSHYRPVLARSDNKVSALWLSANDGTPITANHVTDLINAATLSTVGVAVSPHLFRTAVASTSAIYGGETPILAAPSCTIPTPT